MNQQSSSTLATAYAQQLSRFFTTDQLDAWARETGFIIRSRKLTVLGWLQMLLSEAANLYHFSLGQECGLLAAQAQIHLKNNPYMSDGSPSVSPSYEKSLPNLWSSNLPTALLNWVAPLSAS